jgi:hypothetical protein
MTPYQEEADTRNIALACLLFVACIAGGSYWMNRHDLTDDRAVKAILGEGEGESYTGKLFLAHALINRGTLVGVYGYHRAHKAPRKAVIEAQLAWVEAKQNHRRNDPTRGAQHWLNPKEIKGQVSWVNKCDPTATIGRHVFFKCP